jgi:triosephosphate isomerase (TIM)
MIIVGNWKTNPSSQEEAKSLLRELSGSAIICPPFPYIDLVPDRFVRGAQNFGLSATGEVSIEMLKDLSVKYVIIGHSERKESDDLVRRKIDVCLQAGLIPIVCITEVAEYPSNVILAYEPLSAIGTGNALSCAEAGEMRKHFSQKMLYGGSVNSSNFLDYINVGFDGLLIGGASLKPEEFNKISCYEY